MTKLQELRDNLDELIETEAAKILTDSQFLELPGFNNIMDSILAVSRSEGRAEGAEQERKRIRMECMGPIYDGCEVITTMPNRALYLVPVDVVRPKENRQ